MDNIYRIAISVQNIRHFRLLPVLAGLLLGFSTVHAQERDSTYSADTSRLTINARNELTGGMVLPELMIPEEEMTAYSRENGISYIFTPAVLSSSPTSSGQMT